MPIFALSYALRSLYGLLFLIVPLILTPWNYELFEYNKMMATYAIAVVIGALYLFRATAAGSLRIVRTPLDIPILLFFASQLLSALYSIDPHISWFGYYSRFNGGIWSLLSYITLVVAFGSLYLPFHGKTGEEPHSDPEYRFRAVRGLLVAILGTGALVALYGILERLGIDKHLWVQDVQNRVFSTLGQPNWLAAYLVTLTPLALALSLGGTGKKNGKTGFGRSYILWGTLAVILYLTLLFTRSRSGLLAFAVTDVLLLVLIAVKTTPRKPVLVKLGVIHLIFAAITFFNGTHIDKFDSYFTWRGLTARLTRSQEAPPAAVTDVPAQQSGTLLEYGGTESGTIRKYVWQAAYDAWNSSPKNRLIGTGTETFAWTFFRYRPAGHNLVSEWDFLYNKAHNEYLNYLATTGIFGLGSYLLMLAAMAYVLLRPVLSRQGGADRERQFIQIGILAGWTSILITNFFGFSVVIMQLFLFLLPVFSWLLGDSGLTPRFSVRLDGFRGTVLTAIAAITLLYLLVTLLSMWRADTLFATGYRSLRSGQYVKAAEALEKAISINTGEPLYKDELANALGQLAVSFAQAEEASKASEYAQMAVLANSQAIAISPANVNFWKTQTKIYYALSAFNPEFLDLAIKALESARALSPNDPKVIYNLGILYTKKEDFATALTLMDEAKKLKPNYRDAYFGIYAVKLETGREEEAIAEITWYLENVDPTDVEFTQILENAK